MSGYLQLLPEGLLLVGALVALFGEFLPGRDRGAAFLGVLLATSAALLASIPGGSEFVFGGLLQFDAQARFIRVAVAALTAVWLLWLSGRAMPGERGKEAVSMALFTATGGLLLASSNDLITLYMALELSTMPAYVLMGYRRDDVRGLEGALKYFLLSMLTSLVMLYGFSFLYGLSGSTSLPDIAGMLGASGTLGLIACILSLAGVFAKMSAAPFHFWAPDAYAGAPAASVAFVSTVPKLAGAAVLFRFGLMMAPGLPILAGVIAVVAALSMLLGNFAALTQTDMRRMMAYSGVGHSGYQLIGFAAAVSYAGTEASSFGLAAVLFYALAYAVPSMAILFVVADEGNELHDLAGLSVRRPAAAWGVVVLLLSLVGIPPLGGFIGKLYLFGAGLDAGYAWLTAIGVVASVLSAGYYFRVVRAMFSAPAEENETAAGEDGSAESPELPVGGVARHTTSVAFGISVLAAIGIGLGAGPLSRALGLVVGG
ncbi:MAG: NADH-quinone oxidoreductase subunit N [Coriobacteriia bacterium]